MLSIILVLVVMLLLYSLWGAWDTLLGYNFRYIGIGRAINRVSEANMKRQERRRGLFRPYRIDNDDQSRQ